MDDQIMSAGLRHKFGRPQKFSDDELLAALNKHHGGIFLAAGEIGCSYKTINRRAKACKRIAEALEVWPQKRIDIAEKKLDEALGRGEPWAIKFVLSTLGKSRGYVERHEITGQNGGSIIVRLKKSDR